MFAVALAYVGLFVVIIAVLFVAVVAFVMWSTWNDDETESGMVEVPSGYYDEQGNYYEDEYPLLLNP